MTITSPSGRTYNWNKPTPPTAEDMAALQSYDAQQGGGKAPAQPANMGEVANLPGYTPDAGSPFQASPMGVSGAPAFQKAAAVGADMGMEGVGAAGGQAIGAATGPLAPVAVPALGAAGGMLGNAAGQIRGKIQGDRKDFSLGELLAAGVAGLVPGASLAKAGAKQVVVQAGKQGLTNVAAKQAQVAVDEKRMLTPEEAAMAAGGGVAGVLGMKALDKGVRVAAATTKTIQNAVRDRTWAAAQAAGYVIPPSHINPSPINKILESVAGKADTAQETVIRNQAITNSLAKKAIGLPSNDPIIEETLASVRERAAQPYREVAALDGGTENYTKAVGYSTTQETRKLQGGAELVDELSKTRFQAIEKMKDGQANRNSSAMQEGRELMAKAHELEGKIQQLAVKHGRPDLVPKLKQARIDIAKVHDIEMALHTQSGNIAAGVLGRAEGIGKKQFYTTETGTISDFANAFPKSSKLAVDVPTPGVGQLRPVVASAFAASGFKLAGPAGAAAGFALPFVAPAAARNLILSKPYQSLMASPFYGSTTQSDVLPNAFRMAVEAGARK